MSEVKYSKEHEWIKLEGDVATIGITKHATEMELLVLLSRRKLLVMYTLL